MNRSQIVSFIREHCPPRPLDEVCRAQSLVRPVLELL